MTLKIDEMLPRENATDDGKSSLTVEDVRKRNKELTKIAFTDLGLPRYGYKWQEYANTERVLYLDVLIAIAHGHHDPVALARAALGE